MQYRQYIYIRASEAIQRLSVSRWSRLHLQSLVSTKPYWLRVVGYSPFSLFIYLFYLFIIGTYFIYLLYLFTHIHKGDLCSSSGDINRLMMMIMQSQASVTPH
jgi:hypothetical protein